MKNLILSVCIAICAILGVSSVSAQTITSEMLPLLVAEMNKTCPQAVAEGMVMNRFYLKEDNSILVAEFIVSAKELSSTTDAIIRELDTMSPEEKKAYLGDDIDKLAAMLPVPMVAELKFTDGKVYEMKLTEPVATTSDILEIIDQVNEELPSEVSEGMLLNRFYLTPDKSSIVMEFMVIEKEAGITSDEVISNFDSLSREEISAMFADDIAELAEIFNKPLIAEFKFSDGKSYKLRLSE